MNYIWRNNHAQKNKNKIKSYEGRRKTELILFLLLLFHAGQIFSVECGDVDFSGTIDIVDALLIAQYYVDLNPPNFDISMAEVDGDGIVDIVDALLIAQYYVELISSLPGCSQTPAPTASPAPANDSLIGFATLNGGTTGGQGGKTVTASSYSQLKFYAESSTTYIIMVEGTISNGSGGGTVGVRSNKSIIGVGSTAFLNGVSLSIRNNNIIIRNLKITLVGTSNPRGINDGDTINITGSAGNIWIDHCELYS